ncbi:MAG: hypothetical protein ACR2MT_00300 [Aurantibacter sp.]
MWPDQPEPHLILKGSPYEDDGYKTGTAIIHGKTDFRAPMRFNSAKGVIEFLGDDKVKKEMLRRPYIKASFGGKIYEILEYLKDGRTKLGYFNTLSFGKTQLLFRSQKAVIIENNGSKHQNGSIYAHYKDISEYYIKKEGHPARKIKLNKRSILNSFDVKIRKLLEFAIENQNLNLTKERDVIRLLEYYDTIKQNSSEVKEMQS